MNDASHGESKTNGMHNRRPHSIILGTRTRLDFALRSAYGGRNEINGLSSLSIQLLAKSTS